MNIVTIILIFVFLLLFAHLIVLPLSKRRPIFIKGLEGTFLLSFFAAVIASLVYSIGYLFAILIGLVFYLSNSWFVFGVSKENIESALMRAISASRSTNEQVGNKHIIDSAMQVRINKLVGRLSLVSFSKTSSKKGILTKNIFRKFIENYFI